MRTETARGSQAIGHLLRRMQHDARLAYLIGPGSQTYDLLTLEAAQSAGVDVAEFRREFESTLKTERWPKAGLSRCSGSGS